MLEVSPSLLVCLTRSPRLNSSTIGLREHMLDKLLNYVSDLLKKLSVKNSPAQPTKLVLNRQKPLQHTYTYWVVIVAVLLNGTSSKAITTPTWVFVLNESLHQPNCKHRQRGIRCVNRNSILCSEYEVRTVLLGIICFLPHSSSLTFCPAPSSCRAANQETHKHACAHARMHAHTKCCCILLL